MYRNTPYRARVTVLTKASWLSEKSGPGIVVV